MTFRYRYSGGLVLEYLFFSTLEAFSTLKQYLLDKNDLV